jgi:hypothetical protein
MLAARMSGDAAGRGGDTAEVARDERAAPAPQPDDGGMVGQAATVIGALFGSKLVRDIARTATREVARGTMGRLVGPPPRRRSTRRGTTSGAAAAGKLLKGLFG